MTTYFDENKLGRDFVIGDVHGCYDLVMDAMTSVNFNKEIDRLFCTGDLVDRGPDSFKCLSLVYEKWFFSVRGNHEEMMIAALNNEHSRALDHWLMNGGAWIYSEDINSIKQIANDAVSFMPYSIEVSTNYGKVGIIHAEVFKHDWDQADISSEHATWARTKISKSDDTQVSGIDSVYVGHSIVDAPITLGNVTYIDTGAFHTDKLTVVEL